MIASRSVCFFARVSSPDLLETVEFYAQDIRILRELGYDVRLATRLRDLARPADLYFLWWWTWAFAPLAVAGLLGRRALVTGTFDLHVFAVRALHQRLLMRLALRRADINLFISDMERTSVPAALPTNRPVYAPLGVDTDTYAPGETGSAGADVLSIGWLDGGNAERKGFFDLVRAMPVVAAAVPEVRLLIAGREGSGIAIIRALALQHCVADRVVLLGEVPVEEKIRLMQRCSVYAQPSHHEGFGLAILEAMSCGAPVVTCPSGAVPEVVGDCALLVPPGDPVALASAIISLLQDATLRRALGACARVRAVEQYPLSRRMREIARLLAILDPGGPAARWAAAECGRGDGTIDA